ncbi:MAG TPA: sigma 54-interacting transcriptional regulator [Thermoanaerobaculia bacterium]|nr:sigma 54-interacting transcriptional regulator [Thermoanaerobaculia bacterium]
MRPRLVLLSSPLSGQIFPVGPEGLSIGRHPDNRLLVTDRAASRFHCVVEPSEGRFRVRDLESRQGTFVNGRPVREHLLDEGDLVTVGDLLLLFQIQEAEPAPGEPAGLVSEESFTARTTSQLATQDALRARPDFQMLLRIAGILQAARSTAELARGLLDQVLTAIPGDRAALLLADRGSAGSAGSVGSADIAAAFAVDRRRGASDPFPVSRTVVQAVLGDGVTLKAEDVLLAERLAGAESLRADRIKSLLAAPLVHFGRTLGLLYVDTQEKDEPARPFDEGHLQILTALGGIAAGVLSSVRQMEWLEEENRRLAGSLVSDMVGESPRMSEVYRLIARAAASDSTVLLRGESGTGKEVAARALHQASPRADKPFVAVNCATLSETLLESELFGHERGAFTGAVARKIGKAEAADGGTLFLDELGEIPLALQSKLLRFLQERELDRVGGTQPIRVDVRVVAATNRDLEKAVRDGAFREDLYYRLNVIPVRLPPLRERREDISLLASHFAARIGRRLGRPLTGFTPEARACLYRYDWPGNVRELANAVERALVLGEGDLIRPEDLPETVLEAGGAPEVSLGQYHETLQETKKRLIRGAVAEAGGNITRAAAGLGLQPTYLHRLIRNLGLRGEIRDDSPA